MVGFVSISGSFGFVSTFVSVALGMDDSSLYTTLSSFFLTTTLPSAIPSLIFFICSIKDSPDTREGREESLETISSISKRGEMEYLISLYRSISALRAASICSLERASTSSLGISSSATPNNEGRLIPVLYNSMVLKKSALSFTICSGDTPASKREERTSMALSGEENIERDTISLILENPARLSLSLIF